MKKIFDNMLVNLSKVHNFLFVLISLVAFSKGYSQPTGALSGRFSINETQQVYFSQGNLQYQASTNTWRFAEHQWDYVGGTYEGEQYGTVTGSSNNSISSTYSGWIDLFGWGTSGWNSGSACYQPWQYSSDWFDFHPGGISSPGLVGDYANADWGVFNAISNGGNQPGLWRTLSSDEWQYVKNTRNTLSGIRWAFARVNGVNGVILLPDDWDPSYYSLYFTNDQQSYYSDNIISLSTWSSVFDAHGAVFLPASGWRSNNTYYHIDYMCGNTGNYWSSTTFGNGANRVWIRGEGLTGFLVEGEDSSRGFSVRLVRQAPTLSYSVSTESNPSYAGFVSGSGTYNFGSICTLTATPNAGYYFSNWTVDGEVVSTNPTYSFNVWSNTTVVANFYEGALITASVNPEGAGSVTGAGVFQIGETCTLHAVVYDGYDFQNWTKNGTVVGTEVNYSFTVTENTTYVANFTPRSYTVTVSCEPYYGGTVSGGGTYLYGETYTLSATPAPGYYFAGWKSFSDFFMGSNPYVGSMGDFNERYTALFEPIPDGIYVGDGSSNNYELLPVNNRYSLTQQIYTASEIGMTGGGSIYGVSFFDSNKNISCTCDVYLVHTDKTIFDNGNDWIPVTEANRVFTGQVSLQRAKWATIVFDTPFEYDGTSNLALVVDNNTGSPLYNYGYLCCRVFDTPSNQALEYDLYNEDVDPFSPGNGMLLSMKSQIVFINNSYTITATPSPSNGGTVAGAGFYPASSTCVLTATANSGFIFTNWTENGTVVSSDASYSFTVTGDRSLVANFTEFGGGGDYVDLGLPSGTLWATCNLGANAPEEYGDYFAWGETQTKNNYSWDNYQHCMGSETTLTKYCFASDYGYNGFQDDLTILLPEDDAARAYKGDDWRMPSAEEWQELKQNTTNEWATLNGVSGWLFTASNGARLFLPAAGCRSYDYLFETGTDGMYWSLSLGTNHPDEAFHFYFYFYSDYNFSYCSINDYPRDYGLPIRPVRPSQNIFSINTISNPTEGGTVSGGGSYHQGQTCTLTASPNSGFVFNNWTENGTVVSWAPSYSFMVTEDRALVANFTNVSSGTGVLSGAFSVGETTRINFSQGNLLYQASSNTWRFAENQWDFVGDSNGNISQTLDGWIDLFGWGTSGYDHGATCYQPWSVSRTNSDYYAYGDASYNLYDQTGKADWGYNAICNGGNQENSGWRTLTNEEWNYLFNTRNTTSGIRYAKAQVNDINGVILLPDNWNANYYSLNDTNTSNASFSSNTITATQWTALEQVGAVFLPVAGRRYKTSVYDAGSRGVYWSASSSSSNYSYCLAFYSGDLSMGEGYRYYGYSVRLVRVSQNLSFGINATPNPVEGGVVSGDGTYPEGAECTLTATPNEGYTFVNWTKNGEVVSTDNPLVFAVTEDAEFVANFELSTVTQTINLTSGANWVSTYVDITLDDLKAALLATLPSAAANSIVIKSKDNGSTTYRGSGSWRGNLNALDLSQSYRITVGSDCVIMLEGMPIDPASLDININNGVNWIPFPFDADMTVANAFAGFAYNNDQVKTKINSSSTTYKGSTSSWRGSLSTLIPGQGYVYKSAKSEIRTFHYPTSK